MATPVEEKEAWLRKKIDEVEKKRDAAEAKLENAQGAEKERLQERLNKLEEQLAGYATAIGKLPAAPGML